MNCQEFQTLVHDMIGEGDMETSLRNAAVAHLSGCAQCRLRLSDEQMLVTGLRKIAGTLREVSTPPHVEVRLQSMFRRQQAHRVKCARRPWPRFSIELKKWHWGLAAAAVICLAFGIGMLLLKQKPSLPIVSPIQVAPRISTIAQVQKPSHLESIDSARSVGKGTAGNARKMLHVKVKNHQQSDIKKGRVLSSSKTTPSNEPSTWSDMEYTTDFIPFMSSPRLTAAEDGQVVRVRLPRAAMETFGLPVNRDLAAESIQADVLLGEDGLARAIRFVRDGRRQ